MRYKITAIIILIALVPMTIAGFYFYREISSLLSNNAYNDLNQMVNQSSENIDDSFATLENTSMRILSSSTIRSRIVDQDLNDDAYSLFKIKNDIDSELHNSILFDNSWKSKLLSTMYLFLDDNVYCYVSRSMTHLDIETEHENNVNIYKSVKKSNKVGLLTLPPTFRDQRIYFVRSINNINTSVTFAHLIVGMDENVLYKKYDNILKYPGSKAFIYDANGFIYSHSDKSELGKSVEDIFLNSAIISNAHDILLSNEKYYIAYRKIYDAKLNFVVLIPEKQVLLMLSKSVKYYLFITVFTILLSLVLSIAVSLAFSRFILNLLKYLNKIKSGNYNIRMPSYKDPELNQLSLTFNNMISEIQYLINQVYEKQLLLKQTELKFLHSQMNPHFLFNVLATFKYRAKLIQDEPLYKMVTALSELLQAGIYTNNQVKITVHQEFEYIRFYLYLQKARFEDKLSYTINIKDSSILDYYLPKLCIEPIVENAVVHGIENKIGNGMIIINAFKDENSIYFEIIDNGIGFTHESIYVQDEETPAKQSKGHHNIGLNNTDKRIKLIYGDQYGITIESEYNKGSIVVIHIPIDLGGDQNV